jgi:hypothetical protein
MPLHGRNPLPGIAEEGARVALFSMKRAPSARVEGCLVRMPCRHPFQLAVNRVQWL